MATTKPYVATQPIFFGAHRGYNVGDVVPDEVVKDHGLEELVAREGSQAADKAVSTTTAAQEG